MWRGTTSRSCTSRFRPLTTMGRTVGATALRMPQPKAEYSYERVVEDVFRPSGAACFPQGHGLPREEGVESRVRLAVRQHVYREGPEVRVGVAVQDVARLHAGGDRLRGPLQALPVCDGRGRGRRRRRCDDLLGEPAGVLAAYCEHLEVPFTAGSLTWESRDVRRWDNWEGWHEDAESSTGIEPAERRDPELPGSSRPPTSTVCPTTTSWRRTRSHPWRGGSAVGSTEDDKEKILLRTERAIAPHGGNS